MLVTRLRALSLPLMGTASLLLLLSSLSGCGSGGSDPTFTPEPSPSASAPGPVTTTRAALSIRWGARSRIVSAPSSALSVRVTLFGARPDGSNMVLTLDRGDDPGEYVQNVTTDEPVTIGTHPVTINAYAQRGGEGSLVGYTNTSSTISPDGSGIGDIALTGTVASVAVTPGQTLKLGSTTNIGFVCKDAKGVTVLAMPASAFFTVVDGGNYLRITNGRGEAVLPGTATVRCTVDGVSSDSTPVIVASSAKLTVTPSSATVFAGGSATFAATVADAPDTSVRWSVQEGASGGTVSASGVYQAPTTLGVYHVVATSVYDPSKAVIIPVTVQTDGVRTVYENNFDTAPGAEWSSAKTEATPVGARRFLGQFGPESTRLSLKNLPQHASITVSFKLFIIRSMDGNTVLNEFGDLSGPDIWSLALDGSSLVRTTFSNWEPGGTTSPPSPQSYPNAFGSGSVTARTGASENNTLGYPSYKPAYIGPIQDSVYDLSYTVPHTSSTATFEFKSEQKEDAANESWGLDNVKVTINGR